ncbi:MAG: hypothetical protein Kow0098_19250 [Ignavibacteriaceae bacterium]
MDEKNKEILIVDDEDIIIDAVKKILSSEGYRVKGANDVKIALNKLEKQSFDMIICDIMMPEVDGFQFIDLLNEKGFQVPLIMTTGFSTVENAVKSLYSGAIDFIPKPFTADELLSSVIRGFRFVDLQDRITQQSGKRNSELIYVPCPTTYYRLGYSVWASVEKAGSALIGVTDMFIKTIAEAENIILQEEESELIQGVTGIQFESGENIIHNVISPLSGRIIESNKDLTNDLKLLEKDPYFKGWIYRMIPSDLDYELKHLIPCSSDRL